MSDDAQWRILLIGADMRLYGPAALLVALSLLVRKRWSRPAPTPSEYRFPERSKILAAGGVTLLLAIAAMSTIFFFVSMRRGPLMWDESVFVYKAYGVSEGIRHLNLGASWQAVTTGDRLYPPFSSFVLGAIFAVFGSSQTAAFLCTAVGFVAVTALLFTIGCLLDERRGHIVGLIAALLFLGSPMEIEYAGTAMMEIAGILTTLIAIVAYLWHLRRATELTALATGIALAMAFFTKYNYGLFAIGAVAVCQLSLRQWQPWRRENLWLWVPFVALADLWFTVEGKWEGFLGFANNYDSGMPMLSSTSLLFYPRYFLAEDTSSVLLGGVTVLAGLCAVGWIKQPPVRAVFLFFAVTLGSLTVHHLKEDRYLATVVPVLYLLAGFTLVQVHSRINLPWIRRGVTASGLLLLIPALLLYVKGVPRLVSHNRPSWSSFPWSYRDLYQATDFVLAQIDPRVPTSVTGLINPWSPEYVKWRFESDRPGSKLYLDHLEKGRVNFVWMELLPGSAYRTAEYLQFHPDIEERRAKMAVRVTSGIRTEAVYPRDGLKVVVLRDAEVAR